MPLKSGTPYTKREHMMASQYYLVGTAEKQGIENLTAHHPVEAFPCLEEIHTERWEEEVNTLA